MSIDEPAYWRIYLPAGATDYLAVCMRQNDEPDYDQDRFLSTLRYDTEDQAKAEARIATAAGLTPLGATVLVADLTDTDRENLTTALVEVDEWIVERVQEIINHDGSPVPGVCDEWCIGQNAVDAVHALDHEEATITIVRMLRILASHNSAARAAAFPHTAQDRP